jgi:nitrogen fixation/metabolism regulation signal transduction histidine kinase
MIPMAGDVRQLFDEIAQTMHNEQKEITEFITEMKNIFRLESPKLAQLKLKEPSGEIQSYLNEIKKQVLLFNKP